MKKSVCVITGTRAEFGLLLPLLKKLNTSDFFILQLVVTGSHLLDSFGNTQDDIVASGIPIYAKIPIPMDGDTKYDMAMCVGATVQKFAEYFEKNKPDILVVLGDRYEIFAACSAAALMGIRIAHIHGGETTEGAVDEFLRHSISKMSFFHFTACEEYRRRVIQLGESPDRVFNVGALGVENVMNFPIMSLNELSDDLDFNLNCDYAVVTFHPVTLESGTSEDQLREMIKAMDSFEDMKYVITKANADAGGRKINEVWDIEARKHPNWKVVYSLGVKRYLGVLKGAKMMLGNSSSGILEAPAVHIPTVNIGDRQKGRMMADSIICCEPTTKGIKRAMEMALSTDFTEAVSKVGCPFGDGDTSNRIIRILENSLQNDHTNIKKKFYDIDF